MTEQLLPCPFCASTRQTVKHSGRWGWFVSCECAAVGPSCKTRALAIEAWNRRPHQRGLAPQLVLFDEMDG